MNEADLAGDGNVNYEEFVTMIFKVEFTIYFLSQFFILENQLLVRIGHWLNTEYL